MDIFSGIAASSAVLYIIIGFFVAAFGTLIGAGGGIIFVPLFLWMFNWPPTAVIGTSLSIVLFNALSGSFAYSRQKKIKYDAAFLFAAATIPGSVLGAVWSNWFTGPVFRLSFGILLFCIALVILWKNLRKGILGADPDMQPEDVVYNKPLGILISFFIGFISSIFGIGGGVIHVPAMICLLGFPAHIATATSHFVLAISSFVGVLSHQWQHHILWGPSLLFGLGAIGGAQAGARIAKKVRGRFIMLLLAAALMCLALRLMILS